MKKLIATLLLFTLGLQSYANAYSTQETIIRQEHLFRYKNAPNDKVVITNLRNIICQGNVFEITFDCKFWSEKAKAGDRVHFTAPEAIYTQEGTLLIPACSKLVATVIKIEKPVFFRPPFAKCYPSTAIKAKMGKAILPRQVSQSFPGTSVAQR